MSCAFVPTDPIPLESKSVRAKKEIDTVVNRQLATIESPSKEESLPLVTDGVILIFMLSIKQSKVLKSVSISCTKTLKQGLYSVALTFHSFKKYIYINRTTYNT